MRIHSVPAALISDFWPLVEGYLTQALAFHPFMDAAGLRTVLERGQGELIVSIEDGEILAAVVMETLEYPTQRVGNVVAAGAKVGTLKQHGEEITKHLATWCAVRECRKITLLGRPGWARFFRRLGWQVLPIVAAWKDL